MYLERVIDTCLCFGGDTRHLNGFVNSSYVGNLDQRRYNISYVFKIYGVTRSMLQAIVTLSTT